MEHYGGSRQAPPDTSLQAMGLTKGTAQEGFERDVSLPRVTADRLVREVARHRMWWDIGCCHRSGMAG
jgi:hypothetical protein